MTIYSLVVFLFQFWTLPCPVITVASWSAYRLLMMVCYSHLFKNFPQFVVIYIVKGFSTINEAEVDVFVQFPCFLYDPTDVGNFVSGFSAFGIPACTSESSQLTYCWSLAWLCIYMYIFKFSFFWLCSIIVSDKILNIVSYAIQQIFVVFIILNNTNLSLFFSSSSRGHSWFLAMLS